jgi:dTMP kinase
MSSLGWIEPAPTTLRPSGRRECVERRLALRDHTYPGILVSFCGIDGSGKTSMIEATGAYLEALGMRCFKTRTPTPRIRGKALHGELVDAFTPQARSRIDVLGLCLQCLGDLCQHLRHTIIPRLEQGDVVLCDRYVFTSLAELRARSDDPAVEELLVRVARTLPRPDLAIALDAAARLAECRILSREAELDKPLDREFMAHQARTYLAVAKENDLLILSAERPLEECFARVKARLDRCIGLLSG